MKLSRSATLQIANDPRFSNLTQLRLDAATVHWLPKRIGKRTGEAGMSIPWGSMCCMTQKRINHAGTKHPNGRPGVTTRRSKKQFSESVENDTCCGSIMRSNGNAYIRQEQSLCALTMAATRR